MACCWYLSLSVRATATGPHLMANAGHHWALGIFLPGTLDLGYLAPKTYPRILLAYPKMVGLVDHQS